MLVTGATPDLFGRLVKNIFATAQKRVSSFAAGNYVENYGGIVLREKKIALFAPRTALIRESSKPLKTKH